MSPLSLFGTARRWPVSSNQTACRNALVASTALLERRRERDAVEAFLEHRLGGCRQVGPSATRELA